MTLSYDKRSTSTRGNTNFGADTHQWVRHVPFVLSSEQLLAELRSLRDAGRTTNAALARLIDVPSSRIAEIFDGKRAIKIDEMKIIVEHFQIGIEPPPASVREPGANDNSISLRQVDLAYSMGAGANIDDYVEEGTFDFDASLLRVITRSPPERLYVARGYGDSMQPTLLNDDLVVIDTLQTHLNQQDRIWACSIHGAGAIKRLRTMADRKVLVISDNQTVDNQEVAADDLRIVGRVIWIGRRI